MATTNPGSPAGSESEANRVHQEILEIGTGEYVGKPKADSGNKKSSETQDITLNFDGTDLKEFVKVIVGNILHASYIIDPKVTGKVTVQTAGPITRKELLPLFEDILAANGAAAVDVNGVYHIVPQSEALHGTVAPVTEGAGGATGYAVRIIPLQYVAADEMQKILEPYLAQGGSVRIDTRRNLIIASGTPQELDVIQDTVNIFDVDWMRGMSMGLFPLDYVDPKTMQGDLGSVLGAMTGDSKEGMLWGLVRIVAMDRLNSVLVISKTATALREVETWIHRLDQPGDQAAQRLFVYKVQNTKATDLADILNDIFGSGQVSARTKTSNSPTLAPGLTPLRIGGQLQGAGGALSSSGVGAATGTLSSGSMGAGQTMTAQKSPAHVPPSVSGLTLGDHDKVRIIADDTRNSLVVLSTPRDYKIIDSALRQLDVVPLQVLIEASILEVTLQNDLSYGVEWYFKNGFNVGHGKSGRGTLDLGDAGIAALAPGFSYTIVDTASQVQLALNALAQKSHIRVLSSPSLMVLDNQTAMINVGDEIPVPTSQAVSNIDSNAPTVNAIQFRQTGVTLTVTPRVNNSGLVTMDIQQEVSNAVNTTTSNIDAPTIQQRQIESSVAINSGDTIVLGGLIQDTQTNSDGGIPVLYRIPILGKLFGRTQNNGRRTELLVLITPRVVSNQDNARQITNEFRKKLKDINYEHPG